MIVENVPSIIHDRENVLHRTRSYLEKIGYSCDDGTVDLSLIGVPQLRKRHILIASRTKPIDIKSVVSHHTINHTRTVDWAIGDLQDVKSDALLDSHRRLSLENFRRIDWLFENEKFDLPNELRPPCHRDGHTYYAMYGRLRMDRPANTITTGFGSPGQGRYIHPARRRTLTAHEAARLQLFPDFFDFSPAKSYKELAKMIGNAVPMKLSYIFTLAFLTS